MSSRGQHRGHAGRVARGLGADRRDFGMRMRRTQDGGMQRARLDAEIVDETAAPGQQRCVFHALDRLAAPVRRGLQTYPGRPSMCSFRHISPKTLSRMAARGDTAASQHLPKSLISRVRLRRGGEPMRATRRNSLGLTPAWSRKKRVKCPCALKPRVSLTAARLSSPCTTDFTASLHPQQIEIDVRRHAGRALEQAVEMRA